MTGPFKPGELSSAAAAKLNELWEQMERYRRMVATPPLMISRATGGVPVLTVDGDPPLLCEVTDNDGLTPPAHTVKRKTRDTDNTVLDYAPVVSFESVLNPAESVWPDGTLIFVTKLPDQSGYRWGWAAAGPLDTEQVVEWDAVTAVSFDDVTCILSTETTHFTLTLTVAAGVITLGLVES